jgi:hypothetical protein|tara:strand:+ start:166 stop:390 length:225 start_codon:yes stop_codon:yes gene_type:complete
MSGNFVSCVQFFFVEPDIFFGMGEDPVSLFGPTVIPITLLHRILDFKDQGSTARAMCTRDQKIPGGMLWLKPVY